MKLNVKQDFVFGKNKHNVKESFQLLICPLLSLPALFEIKKKIADKAHKGNICASRNNEITTCINNEAFTGFCRQI